MNRTLTLRRETLTELSGGELTLVQGGAITPGCPTLPVNVCTTFLTCDPTCHTEV